MAEFKVKNIQNASRRVGDRVAKAIRSSGVLEEIARECIEDIQEGKNLQDRRKRLTPLTEGTIKRRKALARVNSTDPKFVSNKSNLTFTGQLIRSIKAKVNRTKGIIIIEPTGTRKPYKGVRGKKLPMDVSTNKALAAKHASGKGGLPVRDILTFGNAKRKEILAKIRTVIKRNLK